MNALSLPAFAWAFGAEEILAACDSNAFYSGLFPTASVMASARACAGVSGK
jgi:hypothetical protein